MRSVLKSKIHRATVTASEKDYLGSIVIDKDLMDRVDLWEYEQVLVCNITNGHRYQTYAIPGVPGSGIISVQGAATHLCQKGDCIIIMAFEWTMNPKTPKAIIVNEHNQFVEYISGAMYEQPVR